MRREMIILMIVLIIITSGCKSTPQNIGGEKDSHGCLIAAGYSWCESKQKCLRTWEENCTTTQNTGIANPASVYCTEQGGKLEIVNEDAGQKGICTLTDGTKCDEWEYYRGECPITNTNNYTITEQTNESCQEDIECKTPGEYLIRSSCPFTSKCIGGKCAVVCPKFNGTGYPDVKECGECPQLMPPGPNFCPDGKIVAGEKNECGCTGAPKCEPIACTAEAKLCPDGSAVGRVGPDCEFAECPTNKTTTELQKNYCTPESKNADVCPTLYQPVCGWFNESIKCIKYPCAITESNSCAACINENVEYWTDGECPK
jgi:uncharacterized protein